MDNEIEQSLYKTSNGPTGWPKNPAPGERLGYLHKMTRAKVALQLAVVLLVFWFVSVILCARHFSHHSAYSALVVPISPIVLGISPLFDVPTDLGVRVICLLISILTIFFIVRTLIKPGSRIFLILANLFLIIYWLCAFLVVAISV